MSSLKTASPTPPPSTSYLPAETVFVNLLRSRGIDSQPREGRYPIWRTGPPGYIAWRNRFLGIDSWALKRLHIRALISVQRCTKTRIYRSYVCSESWFNPVIETYPLPWHQKPSPWRIVLPWPPLSTAWSGRAAVFSARPGPTCFQAEICNTFSDKIGSDWTSGELRT